MRSKKAESEKIEFRNGSVIELTNDDPKDTIRGQSSLNWFYFDDQEESKDDGGKSN